MVNGAVLTVRGPTEAQIRAQRIEISTQQRRVPQAEARGRLAVQQQAEVTALSKDPGTFDVTATDRGGGKTPQNLTVVATFPTRAEAERFLNEEARPAFGRDTPLGVRATPSAATLAKTPRLPGGGEITGPPKSTRGLKRQVQSQELQRISRKVGVTQQGQIDLTRLSRGEQARIKQITGVTAKQAFTVERKPEVERVREERVVTRAAAPRLAPVIPKARRAPVTVRTGPQFQEVTLGLTRGGRVTGFEARPIKIPTRFEQIESVLAELTTRKIPSLRPDIKTRGFLTGDIDIGIRTDTAAGRAFAGFERAAREEIRERPLTLVSFAGAGGIFRGIGAVARRVGLGRVFTGVAAGLGATAVGVTGAEIIAVPTAAERGAIAGRAFTQFGAFGFGVRAAGVIPRVTGAVTRMRFERKVRLFEAEITDPEFRFGQPVFEPVRTIVDPTVRPVFKLEAGVIRPRRRVIVEVQEVPRGFPTFGRAGEITGIQTQLRPTLRRPEFEAQAEFAPPRLGVEFIRGRLPEREGLVRFVERPLTPFQVELAREPPRVIRPVSERQQVLAEFRTIRGVPISEFFRITPRRPTPTEPRFVSGVFQVGGLLPPIQIPRETPFERFGGEFFERVPRARRVPLPRVEVAERARLLRGITPIFIAGITPTVAQRAVSIQRAVPIQRPAIALDLLQAPRPIIVTGVIPAIAQVPAVRLDITQQLVTGQRRELVPFLDQIPVQVLIPITGRPTRPPTRRVRRPPTQLRLPIAPLIKLPDKARAGVTKPAFNTEVREGERKKDRFIGVPGPRLPRNKAINRGARIVDNTVARSFRIKQQGTTLAADDSQFFLKRKFRGRIGKTKLPPKTFVELSKFAIDSSGERLGIPFAPSRIPRLREALAMRGARRIPRPLQTGGGRVMKFL